MEFAKALMETEGQVQGHRMVRVLVGWHIIGELIRPPAGPPIPDFVTRIATTNLPASAACVAMTYEPACMAVNLFFTHPSFAIVPAGHDIPILNMTLEMRRYRVCDHPDHGELGGA